MLLLLLLLSSCVITKNVAGCNWPQEDNDFGISEIEEDGLFCSAIGALRMAFKTLKMTYERWRTEVDFMKCMAGSFNVDGSILSPPWEKNSMKGKKRKRRNSKSRVITPRHLISDLILPLISGISPYVQPVIDILRFWWRLFGGLQSYMQRPGLFSCSVKYVKGVFWKWVDKAPGTF